MNKEALLKITEDIIKEAAVTREYLKEHSKEINEAFQKYIKSKQFPKGRTKVPYEELDQKFKERVWVDFLAKLEHSMNPIEKQVEDVIRLMKTPTQLVPGKTMPAAPAKTPFSMEIK